ncbi:hypothetical protein Tco_1135047, partial [Tanacetum coccineum]
MRTRFQSRNQNHQQQQAPPVVVEPFNLEEPFDNPPIVNMAANGAGGAGPTPAGGGGLPVPDLRTMEELCQPSLDGRVKNSYPFRGPGDDANKHLDKFLHVTQSMKVNGVSDDALRLHLLPYSLQDRVAEWFDHLPRNSINSFDQMAKCMRTRSQSRNQNCHQQQAPPVVVEPFNLEEPFDNPPVVNMAANGAGGAGPPPAGGGGLPIPDLRTMEELCQPSLDGR